MPAKYIGHVVTIIYMDSKGTITQRRIRVIAIAGGRVSAYDMDKQAPRSIRLDRILATEPVKEGRSA